MSRERPSEFAKLFAGIVPRELWLDSTVNELEDGELDALIEQMRQRLLVACGLRITLWSGYRTKLNFAQSGTERPWGMPQILLK